MHPLDTNGIGGLAWEDLDNGYMESEAAPSMWGCKEDSDANAQFINDAVQGYLPNQRAGRADYSAPTVILHGDDGEDLM
jgi:hypothetical protein